MSSRSKIRQFADDGMVYAPGLVNDEAMQVVFSDSGTVDEYFGNGSESA